MRQRIEDYALIGDCGTAALVGRNGSIDWLCWPRFDSGAVFAALLGDDNNGHWSLGVATADAEIRRRYLPGTLILETEIEASGGTATVVDFMPLRREGSSHLVRLVQGRKGTVKMATELVLRFDHGSLIPWVTRHGEHSLHAIAGPDSAVLHSGVPLQPANFRHRLVGDGACFEGRGEVVDQHVRAGACERYGYGPADTGTGARNESSLAT